MEMEMEISGGILTSKSKLIASHACRFAGRQADGRLKTTSQSRIPMADQLQPNFAAMRNRSPLARRLLYVSAGQLTSVQIC